MGWDLALAAAATYAKPEAFETFRRHLDPAWIEEALTTTGTATVRRRRRREDQDEQLRAKASARRDVGEVADRRRETGGPRELSAAGTQACRGWRRCGRPRRPPGERARLRGTPPRR